MDGRDGSSPVKTVGLLPALSRNIIPSLLILAVGMAIASVVIFNLPARYRARAVVTVRPPLPSDDMRDASLRRTELVHSLRVRLTAMPTLLNVAEEVDLYPETRRLGPHETALAFREDLVVVRDGERAFQLLLEGENPQKVAAALNLLIREATRAEDENSVQNARRQLDWIESRQGQSSRQIQELNERIAAYKRSNRESLPEQMMANLMLLSQTHERLVLDAAEEAREVREANRSLAMMEAEARGRLAELQSVYHDRHPEVIRASTNLARLAELRAEAHARQERGMISSARATNVRNLENRVRELEGRIFRTPVVADRLAVMMEERRLLTERNEALLGDRDLALWSLDVASGPYGSGLVILESARAPVAPFQPNRVLLMSAALLLCIGLAVSVAVGREAARQTVLDGQELKRALGVRVLTDIPHHRIRLKRVLRRGRRHPSEGVARAPTLATLTGDGEEPIG